MEKSKLHIVDIRNPKDIIIEGLNMKIAEMGDLRVPFDVSKNYPGRETFLHEGVEHRVPTRRIVVRRLANTIHIPALGHVVDGEFNDLTETILLGWTDHYVMEISVWTSTQEDRDNILELIKIWMLELEQKQDEDGMPFFLRNNIEAVRFTKAYEDDTVISAEANVPIFVGVVLYDVIAAFEDTTKKLYERYKLILRARLLGHDNRIVI